MHVPSLTALVAALALLAPAAATDAPIVEEPLAYPFYALDGGPCLSGRPAGAELLAEGFEQGAPGWTSVSSAGRANLWHWTTFAGNGSATDDAGHDGPGRLYYGIENAHGGTYNTSRTRNQGEMRSPTFAVPETGTTAIAIRTKWHVEFDRPWLIDAMTVGYARSGTRTALCYLGNAWAGFYNVAAGYGYYQSSPTGQATFTACEYSLESPQNPCRLARDRARLDLGFDLAPVAALWEERWVPLPASLAGEAVSVSLHFQTGDAIVDDAMGWMVDDVAVVHVT